MSKIDVYRVFVTPWVDTRYNKNVIIKKWSIANWLCSSSLSGFPSKDQQRGISPFIVLPFVVMLLLSDLFHPHLIYLLLLIEPILSSSNSPPHQTYHHGWVGFMLVIPHSLLLANHCIWLTLLGGCSSTIVFVPVFSMSPSIIVVGFSILSFIFIRGFLPHCPSSSWGCTVHGQNSQARMFDGHRTMHGEEGGCNPPAVTPSSLVFITAREAHCPCIVRIPMDDLCLRHLVLVWAGMRKGWKWTTTFVMVCFHYTPPGQAILIPSSSSYLQSLESIRIGIQPSRRGGVCEWMCHNLWESAHITYMVEGMILGGHQPTSLSGGEGPRCWWATIAMVDKDGGERRLTISTSLILIFSEWYLGITQLVGKPGLPRCLSPSSLLSMARKA